MEHEQSYGPEEHLPEWVVLIRRLYEEARLERMSRLNRIGL